MEGSYGRLHWRLLMTNREKADEILDKLPDTPYHQKRYVIRRDHPYYWPIFGTVVGAIVLLLLGALALQK